MFMGGNDVSEEKEEKRNNSIVFQVISRCGICNEDNATLHTMSAWSFMEYAIE